jgi:hypothetical protein
MKKRLLGIIFLSVLGAIYSFSLFLPHFLSGSCGFGSVCPMLFSLPICLYGCIGFVVVGTLAISIFFAKDSRTQTHLFRSLFWITLLGMLFALYFLIVELFTQNCFGNNCSFSLGYPSCLYGFFLFFGSFLLSKKDFTTLSV